MISSVVQLLEIMAILVCFSKLYGRKKILNGYTVLLLAVEMLLFTCVNKYNFPLYFLIFAHVGLFLYCVIFYRAGIKVAVLNYILAIAIIGGLQLLFCIPIIQLFGEKNIEIIWDDLLINALCFITITLCGNRLKLKEISSFFQKKNRLLVGIAIFIMIYLGKNIFEIRVNSFINIEDGLQIICFLFLLLLLINEWQKAVKDAERKKTQLEMNKLYSAAYEELITLISLQIKSQVEIDEL